MSDDRQDVARHIAALEVALSQERRSHVQTARVLDALRTALLLLAKEWEDLADYAFEEATLSPDEIAQFRACASELRALFAKRQPSPT